MRQEIEQSIQICQEKRDFIHNNIPPILLADLEAIVHMMLTILIAMLKRELKRLA